MHTATVRLVTLLSLVCVAAACDGGSPPLAATGECGHKIAFMGPITGETATDLAQSIHLGAELAFAQYNVGACPVDLVDFDTQGDPKQAPALAQQIVEDRRIVGVIGPTLSGETEAATPILDQGGVTMITTSATRTVLADRGWATFHRVLGNDAMQGQAAGQYISDVLYSERVFVIDDGAAYGRGLADEVTAALGYKVVQRAAIRPRQTGFDSVIGQIRSADADAVFFGGYYNEAGPLLRQLRGAGVTATFVTGDGAKQPGFITGAGERAVEGAVLTCPCLPPELAANQFPHRYRTKFGQNPGTNSAEAYDAATIFLAGIAAGYTSRAEMETFVDAYAGRGVTTTLRFTTRGELEESSVTVWAYTVRRGQFVADREIALR